MYFAKAIQHLPEQIRVKLQRHANRIARCNGFWRADEISFTMHDEIVYRIDNGWRKKTTGQYVPNAYACKGWSSVYYQNAWTHVGINTNDIKL